MRVKLSSGFTFYKNVQSWLIQIQWCIRNYTFEKLHINKRKGSANIIAKSKWVSYSAVLKNWWHNQQCTDRDYSMCRWTKLYVIPWVPYSPLISLATLRPVYVYRNFLLKIISNLEKGNINNKFLIDSGYHFSCRVLYKIIGFEQNCVIIYLMVLK